MKKDIQYTSNERLQICILASGLKTMLFQNIRPLGYTDSQSQGKLIILVDYQNFYQPTLNVINVSLKTFMDQC